MATQAPRVMRQYLALASRHAAKQSQGVKGSRSTGRIHSLRTFKFWQNCFCKLLAKFYSPLVITVYVPDHTFYKYFVLIHSH